jgi:flagellar biosynthesis GTPase FlhF
MQRVSLVVRIRARRDLTQGLGRTARPARLPARNKRPGGAYSIADRRRQAGTKGGLSAALRGEGTDDPSARLTHRRGSMPAWAWILIIATVVVLGVLIAVALKKVREMQRDRKRREADRLRLDAERKLAGAEHSEQTARQAAATVTEERTQADRMRNEAEAREARAEELEEIAEREVQRAREQRTSAEQTARKAQSVDPRASDPEDDFDVDEALAGRSTSDPSRLPAEAGDEEQPGP